MTNQPITLHFNVNEHFDASDLHDQGRVLLHHFIEQLVPHGVTFVQADFTGSGDSAEDCTWNFTSTAVDLNNAPTHEVRIHDVNVSAETAATLENFVWSFVDAHHAGWENNAGGFGTVSFDLVARSCVLDMNERYEDSNNLGETELFNDNDGVEPDAEGTLEQQQMAEALLKHGIDLDNVKIVTITVEEAEALLASPLNRYLFQMKASCTFEVYAPSLVDAMNEVVEHKPDGFAVDHISLLDSKEG